MTGPAVQDDPMLRLRYYRETGQADEAKNYEAYLRETNQWRTTEVTPLPSGREKEFRAWIKRNNITDLDDPRSKYDYRGAFLAGVGSQVSDVDGLPHWPDTFKQHGHPTFSVESKYSAGPNDGGRWNGETYIPQGSHDSQAILRRNARGAANDRDAASVEEPDYASRLFAHVLNAAQGIPGMRAVEAGAGALGSKFTDHPLTFAQSRGLLDEQTGNIGGKTSAFEHLLGGVATLPFLPANPTVAGGLLGAADEATNADDESLMERAGKTAVGAGIGALVGRYADKAVTGGRTLLTKSPAKEVLRMKADRALSAKTMYDLALKQGEGKTATQAIKDYVAEPDIAEIVAELQGTHALKGVEATAPKMLDAIYKTLSDRAATVKKGLESVTPNKPNIGRFRGKDIQSAQERLLTAMEKPGSETVSTTFPAMETAQSPAPSVRDAIDAFQRRLGLSVTRKEGTSAQQMARTALERHGAEASIPPIRGGASPTTVTETRTTPAVMPTYRAAVDDFAKRSSELGGMQKGYEAVLSKLGANIPSFKNLDRKTPEAFAEWIAKATPAERAAAIRGLLGATKSAFGQPGKTLAPGRRAVAAATDLLRIADPNAGRAATVGLLGINGVWNTP